jgi:hypothetical protein
MLLLHAAAAAATKSSYSAADWQSNKNVLIFLCTFRR